MTALPEAMQGSWIDPDDDEGTLDIDGAYVAYRGSNIAYDRITVEERDGALCVDFHVDDSDREDSFSRENLTGLVIDPEGDLHGFNTRFATSFVRRT